MAERPVNVNNNMINQAVIDDLTEKIKDGLKAENPDADNEVVVEQLGNNRDPNRNSLPPGADCIYEVQGAEGEVQFKDDEEEGETKEKDDEDDDDSFDETHLKDAGMAMTDDQKEEMRIIAEELKVAGNNAYKDGDFERSAEKYTEGLMTCPLQFTQLRAVLFCNRSAAKMKMGKYKKAAADCTKAIELDDKYMKAYVRRAQSYEEIQKYDESLADYKKILEMDPSHQDARKATFRLPPLIEEKNEKLKTEMLGKLKDLGNIILKPFGLSTDNFNLEQEPGSKGYKINFKQ